MTKDHLITAKKKISEHIHRTPVMTSRLINEMAHCNVFFKCENFQRMGAYKMRGATHAISNLSETEKSRGVVTHSSGNFAQALSLAAKRLGVKAYIVMPNSAPEVKKQAVNGYGGKITMCESTLEAREHTANNIVKDLGATFIHPSNNLDVILGNATCAIELLEDYPHLDTIMTPIGGGGLIAGTALAAHFFGNQCNVIGGEPLEADDAFRSLQSGRIETNVTTNTIADGLKTNLGDINFPIIKSHVNDIIRVSEEDIKNALKLIWERLKIVVEPSSAVALAALLRKKKRFANKDVGIIISGGNVDLTKLQSYI